jgi:hypothetical protein
MNSPGALDPRHIRPFVDAARHQLALLKWEEIEPSLAVSWAELREPGLPNWDSIADLVRRTAQGEIRDG